MTSFCLFPIILPSPRFLSFSLLRFFGGLFFKPNNVSFGILSNLRHPCSRPLGFQIKAPLDYLIFMFLSVLLSLTLSLQSSAHKFFLLCVLHSQAVTDLRLLHFPDPCYLLAFPLRLLSNFRTILLLALTISLSISSSHLTPFTSLILALSIFTTHVSAFYEDFHFHDHYLPLSA